MSFRHLPGVLQLPDQPQQQGEYNAEDDHGGNREIKTKVLPFNTDVSRQATDPVQLVVKEVDRHPCNHNEHSCCNNIFTRFGAHEIKLKK